jgi:hypothetical protein
MILLEKEDGRPHSRECVVRRYLFCVMGVGCLAVCVHVCIPV